MAQAAARVHFTDLLKHIRHGIQRVEEAGLVRKGDVGGFS
jgi:hypothetical protein